MAHSLSRWLIALTLNDLPDPWMLLLLLQEELASVCVAKESVWCIGEHSCWRVFARKHLSVKCALITESLVCPLLAALCRPSPVGAPPAFPQIRTESR